MTLYNCKHVIPNDGTGRYRITKFDSGISVESSYLCTTSSCDCPAGVRPTCRHRDMLPKFLHRGYVGTEWFFDYDRGGWVQGEAHYAEPTIASYIELPADADVAEEFGKLLSGSELPIPPSIEPPSSLFMKRRFF